MAFQRLGHARRGRKLRSSPSAPTLVGTQSTISLEVFSSMCELYNLPVPVAEYRFHVERKWRFDFAYPAIKVAVEIEGGAWTRGRHTRGKGFILDCEKYNEAQIRGWKVLKFTPSQVRSGVAFAVLKRALPAALFRQIRSELRAESGLGEYVPGPLQDAVLS
jgi:hypothetical protein